MNILVLHGPNLNMLGKRNKDHYGSFTLDELYETISDQYQSIDFTFYQSNYEGELIEVIHQAIEEDDVDALMINPGALTHTSIALRDALEMMSIPKVEVHLSNIDNREPFRQVNYIKDVVDETFMGKKIESYYEAIEYLLSKLVV
ncbi:MAG: type II 3-dehydroquinate dehydratase [Acholeplasmataceae bacterium]|jgi:3-dehydroquinate dehydratase-2|nr:type II 3-dehydroquinate dehydratase [Acholeplasmataceae bacterium]